MRHDKLYGGGGGQTKVHDFCLHSEQIRQPWRTQYHANRSIETSPHPIISGEMIRHDKSMVTGMDLCTPRVPNLFKVQTKIPLLFSSSPYSSDLKIQTISACHVSNERKQISDQIYNLLFLSRGYTYRVEVIPTELLIY